MGKHTAAKGDDSGLLAVETVHRGAAFALGLADLGGADADAVALVGGDAVALGGDADVAAPEAGVNCVVFVADVALGSAVAFVPGGSDVPALGCDVNVVLGGVVGAAALVGADVAADRVAVNAVALVGACDCAALVEVGNVALCVVAADAAALVGGVDAPALLDAVDVLGSGVAVHGSAAVLDDDDVSGAAMMTVAGTAAATSVCLEVAEPVRAGSVDCRDMEVASDRLAACWYPMARPV